MVYLWRCTGLWVTCWLHCSGQFWRWKDGVCMVCSTHSSGYEEFYFLANNGTYIQPYHVPLLVIFTQQDANNKNKKKKKNSTFWDTTQCIPMKVNRHFGGTHHLHLLGWRITKAKNRKASYLLSIGFLLGLFLNPEDGSNMFLQNVGWLWMGYTTSYHSQNCWRRGMSRNNNLHLKEYKTMTHLTFCSREMADMVSLDFLAIMSASNRPCRLPTWQFDGITPWFPIMFWR
jgi:hypothetical protein